MSDLPETLCIEDGQYVRTTALYKRFPGYPGYSGMTQGLAPYMYSGLVPLPDRKLRETIEFLRDGELFELRWKDRGPTEAFDSATTGWWQGKSTLPDRPGLRVMAGRATTHHDRWRFKPKKEK